MPRFFDPLLKLIIGDSEKELLAQIQFLKAENRLLRSKLPKVIRLTPAERARLLCFGCLIRWSVLRELITIAKLRTFARWMQQARDNPECSKKRRAKTGRPPTPDDIRELVVRIARETGLGYTRIQGELKKLGIDLSRSTITNILKNAGMSPDPSRGEGRWDEFLKMHADSLWACDFFCVHAWTLKELRQFYMILFIHIGSRRIMVTPSTVHPTKSWVTQQARNVCIAVDEEQLAATHLIRDRDRKFVESFDTIIKAGNIQRLVLPRNSPNLNAFAERAIQSLKHECLDHFVLLGERHVNYLIEEYVEFYNTRRPHSAIGKLPPVRDGPRLANGRVMCESRLGGLLRHYYREAA